MIFLSVKDKRKGKKSSKETRPKINVTNYNENEHECDICEEILTSKWSLQNHKLKKHHDILGIGYKCDKCDYTAKDAKRLKEHESSKHNPKYRCDQCDFVAPLSHKVQGGRMYALNVHKIRKHGEHNMVIIRTVAKKLAKFR